MGSIYEEKPSYEILKSIFYHLIAVFEDGVRFLELDERGKRASGITDGYYIKKYKEQIESLKPYAFGNKVKQAIKNSSKIKVR